MRSQLGPSAPWRLRGCQGSKIYTVTSPSWHPCSSTSALKTWEGWRFFYAQTWLERSPAKCCMWIRGTILSVSLNHLNARKRRINVPQEPRSPTHGTRLHPNNRGIRPDHVGVERGHQLERRPGWQWRGAPRRDNPGRYRHAGGARGGGGGGGGRPKP